MCTPDIPMKRIIKYHPHLHLNINSNKYVFCADANDFMTDEELSAIIRSAIGKYEALLNDIDACRIALAAYGIVNVHVHNYNHI